MYNCVIMNVIYKNGGLDMTDISQDNLPWLIFIIKNRHYAVNSSYITEILMKPGKITPLPEAPEIYTGMIERRGDVYPIISMRKVFRMDTVEDECDAFDRLIDGHCEKIKQIAEDLKNCIEDGTPFEHTLDPKETEFGKWFSAYMATDPTEGFFLVNVEEPYNMFYAAAAELFTEGCSKRKLLNKAFRDCLPKVLQLLDDVKRVRRAFFKQTVVVISDDEGNTVGLMADKVVAVDSIQKVVGSGDAIQLLQSDYFEGVARNSRINGDILTINAKKLLGYSDIEQYK